MINYSQCKFIQIQQKILFSSINHALVDLQIYCRTGLKSDDTLFVQVGNAQATDANTAIKSPNAVSIEYLKFGN